MVAAAASTRDISAQTTVTAAVATAKTTAAFEAYLPDARSENRIWHGRSTRCRINLTNLTWNPSEEHRIAEQEIVDEDRASGAAYRNPRNRLHPPPRWPDGSGIAGRSRRRRH